MKFKRNRIPSLELHFALSNLFDAQNVQGCKNGWRNVSIFLYSENKDLYVWRSKGGVCGGGAAPYEENNQPNQVQLFLLSFSFSAAFLRNLFPARQKKEAYPFSLRCPCIWFCTLVKENLDWLHLGLAMLFKEHASRLCKPYLSFWVF